MSQKLKKKLKIREIIVLSSFVVVLVITGLVSYVVYDSQASKLLREKEELQLAFEQLQEEYDDLNNRNAASENDNLALEQELSEKELIIQQKDVLIDSKNNEIATLNSQIQNYSSQIQNLNSDKSALNNEIADLQTRLSKTLQYKIDGPNIRSEYYKYIETELKDQEIHPINATLYDQDDNVSTEYSILLSVGTIEYPANHIETKVLTYYALDEEENLLAVDIKTFDWINYDKMYRYEVLALNSYTDFKFPVMYRGQEIETLTDVQYVAVTHPSAITPGEHQVWKIERIDYLFESTEFSISNIFVFFIEGVIHNGVVYEKMIGDGFEDDYFAVGLPGLDEIENATPFIGVKYYGETLELLSEIEYMGETLKVTSTNRDVFHNHWTGGNTDVKRLVLPEYFRRTADRAFVSSGVTELVINYADDVIELGGVSIFEPGSEITFYVPDHLYDDYMIIKENVDLYYYATEEEKQNIIVPKGWGEFLVEIIKLSELP